MFDRASDAHPRNRILITVRIFAIAVASSATDIQCLNILSMNNEQGQWTMDNGQWTMAHE